MSKTLTQDYRHLYVPFEAVVGGVAVTGLEPTCVIKRESDGMFWSDDDQTWQASPEDIVIPEIDSTNLPGKYKYFLGPDSIDLDAGAKGYSVYIEEESYRVKEHLDIVQSAPDAVADAVLDAPAADHDDSGTIGESIGTATTTRFTPG